MRETKRILIGKTPVGGGSPVTIQSMTNTPTKDIESMVAQIKTLEEEGCDVIRVSVSDSESAKAISKIKEKIKIPLVADIHFDHKLALEAIAQGADKIRINPGNIGKPEKVKEITTEAKRAGISIRVGVNSGSVKKEFLDKYENASEALVQSALESVRLLESFDFDRIVVSVKASHLNEAMEAYREISKRIDYPLHLGLTEAGTATAGIVKSSILIGTLLGEGIGDTIRVSLTADPVLEVRTGRFILNSLGLKKYGIDLISCPTCARCEIDLIPLAEAVERELAGVKTPLTVAVMGCSVNGPGEARSADIGIAAGKGEGLLFAGGKVIRKVPEKELLETIVNEVHKLII